jgi:hypothetical protein
MPTISIEWETSGPLRAAFRPARAEVRLNQKRLRRASAIGTSGGASVRWRGRSPLTQLSITLDKHGSLHRLTG